MSETEVAGEFLTLQQAADELQVHYMTAYRWVSRGDLPAFKAGGRLRIKRTDLDAYVDARQVDTALAQNPESTRDWKMHVARLKGLLLEGDAAQANALVRRVVGDGASAAEVYTELLTPVLRKVGEEWEAGAINVAIEHRATAIVSGIMSRMSESFRRRGPRVGVATTLTAPGESHGVGAAMIADFLRAAGWEVHHLGTDVPLEDLKLFLDIVPADVVCVSAVREVPADVYEGLAEACQGRQLVMGGPGVDLTLAEPLGITVLEAPFDLVEHLRDHSDPAR